MAINASEAEQRAAVIMFERDTGKKLAFSEIPDGDCTRILGEIRTRMFQVEQNVNQEMLESKTVEDRWSPRRQLIAAVIAAVVVIVVIVALRGLAQSIPHK